MSLWGPLADRRTRLCHYDRTHDLLGAVQEGGGDRAVGEHGGVVPKTRYKDPMSESTQAHVFPWTRGRRQGAIGGHLSQTGGETGGPRPIPSGPGLRAEKKSRAKRARGGRNEPVHRARRGKRQPWVKETASKQSFGCPRSREERRQPGKNKPARAAWRVERCGKTRAAGSSLVPWASSPAA